MSTMVVAQKTPDVFDDERLLAHNLIDKLAVIVGQCELLSEHISDVEGMARLKSIEQTAKLMADVINCRQREIAGTLRMRSGRGIEGCENESRDQDHNFG